MDGNPKVISIFNNLQLRYAQLQACQQEIWDSYLIMNACFAQGNKLLLCGNGGSACDALHIVGELMKEFTQKRTIDTEVKQYLQEQATSESEYLLSRLQGTMPAISLVENAGLASAVNNDIAGDLQFAQQTYGLGNPGDVLVCLSTSGNSINVYYAALTAKARGMKVISFTGQGGGKLYGISDVCIRVPETETYLLQELHLPIYHALCRMLEANSFASGTE